MGCSQILTIGIQNLQVDLMLIRLVVMGFSRMFSDPHYRYKGPTGGSCVRLVDMSFSEMFSDPHYRYTEPTGGSNVNQIGGHGFQ